MGNMIKMLVVLLVMFSLSAGASWYVNSLYPPKESGNGDEHEKEAKKGSGKGGKSESSLTENSNIFRSGYTPEGDQWSSITANLKAREEAIQRQQDAINARLKTFDLITQDWRVEKAITEDFQKKIDAEARALTDRVAVLEKSKEETVKQRRDLDEKLVELSKKLFEVEGVEVSRLPQIAAAFDGMPVENAANTFKEMVEKGSMDLAVKIISSMKPRAASGVLGAMPPGMTNQLVERLKGLQQPTKKD